MSIDIETRFMEIDDVERIIKIQQEQHQKIDPEFETVVYEDFVWKPSEILSEVRKYKNDNLGTNDTRAYTATHNKKIVGGMLCELEVDAYQILLIVTHPSVANAVRTEFLNKIERKARGSKTRHRITSYVPDGDYATLKFFQDKGFKIKFKPDKEKSDNWFVSKDYEYKPVKNKGKDKDDDDDNDTDDPLGNFAAV